MAVLGRFCWYDLFTPNTDASSTFYSDVVGWSIQNFAPAGAPPYPMLMPKGAKAPVGGIRSVHAAGAHAHWLGYIACDDMATSMMAAEDAGAKVQGSPQNIPGVGRFVVLRDPTGGTFALFRAADDTPGHDGPKALGEFGWHELMTTDPEAAWAFYAKVFKWEKGAAMEMGHGGTYQMFRKAGTSVDLGGMMKAPEGMPGSAWNYYATVADADAALAKAKGLGAKVMVGPMDVAGGGRAATVLDTQGAMFAMFSQKKG